LATRFVLEDLKRETGKEQENREIRPERGVILGTNPRMTPEQ